MTRKEIVKAKEDGKEGEAAPEIIAAMIRQSSEAGQLLAETEIRGRVAEQHIFAADLEDPIQEVETILTNLVRKSPGLHALADSEGSRYFYSSQFMMEAYAKILLGKQGSPLRLIAEIVRQNSAFYPRPIALDIFTQPPFDLPAEEVLNDLQRMAGAGEYGDIAQTQTSTSRIFLYSTLHLEPEHASMLAEWLDVGQSSNP
jgi:hypothetical protein